METGFGDHPSQFVRSPDGTPIAVFSAGPAAGEPAVGPPLVLVHGTTSDHLTWRVLGPLLAARRRIHAIDRRGRGASGDGETGAYAIERELDDLAAVAAALADEHGGPADVVGHSLGGRIALGTSLRTAAIRRVVAYESAPAARAASHGPRDGLLDALRADLARGDREAVLERFMRDGVGMPEGDLAAFRVDPVWRLRVAAAATIVRELAAADEDRTVAFETLARVRVPVLQLVGSASGAGFRDAAAALDARLPDGRLMIIDGARHGAHHSHPDAFVAAVEGFLA